MANQKPRAQLTKHKVREIYAASGTLQEIGYRFDVSPAHVGCIKRGSSHAAVTGAILVGSKRKVLSAELIKQIEEHSGTVKDAANEFGVSVATIKKYRKRAWDSRPREIGRDVLGHFLKSEKRV